MWQDLVDQEEKWLGGTLIDFGDEFDRRVFGPVSESTPIVGFELTDTHFHVLGKDFDCGGSRGCVGRTSEVVDNGLALRGYGGHKFHIVQCVEVKQCQ